MTTTTATSRHLYSPLGDQREQHVPCRGCLRRTWNVCGRCDTHCDCPEASPVPGPATARTDIPAPRGCTR